MKPDDRRGTFSTSAARIALIAPKVKAHGGSEEYLRAIVAALEGAGARVTVFSATAGEPNARPAALAATHHPLKQVKAARAVAEFADELARDFDVVDFQRVAPLPLVRALGRRVIKVLTAHTIEQTCPAGSRYLPASGSLCARRPGTACLAHHRREGCLRFADGRPFSWRDRAHSLLQLRAARKAHSLMDLAIYNSVAARHCLERFGAKPRAVVIHPPLLTARRSGDNAPRVRGRVLYVGRLETAKGVLDLPEVVARLPAHATLEVIGDGFELAALKARMKERGLIERVTFRGWLDRADVATALARASCVVVPSRGFEAWGMVGPEAIALGCPVAAYDCGGMGEWCHAPWGTLVPHGDVAALAGAVAQWLVRTDTGLDTSSWNAEAQARWGTERWLREYAAAIQDVMHVRQ